MYELLHPASGTLPAIWALEDYLRHEGPRFLVLEIIKYSHPKLKVRDCVYGTVVAFSCEADYRTYCRVTSQPQEEV